MMSGKLTCAIPVVPFAYQDDSRDFYVQKLGFTLEFEHPGYVGLVRDGVHIHLSQIADPEHAHEVGSQVMLRFVTPNVETLYAEYQAHEGVIHPNGALARKPWGTYEFAVLDPCGVCISFMQG